MRYLQKKSIAPIPPASGSVSDTLNITDKTTNTYSARIIDILVGSGGGGSGVDVSTLADLFYPIGRGFIDFTDTDYSNYLGFTWERELVGMFPVGYDSDDEDFNTIGKTGGEKEHLLTVDELPSHSPTSSFKLQVNSDNGSSYPNDYVISGGSSGTRSTKTITVTNNTVGGDTPHNNLPPYKVVSYWKRVA